MTVFVAVSVNSAGAEAADCNLSARFRSLLLLVLLLMVEEEVASVVVPVVP